MYIDPWQWFRDFQWSAIRDGNIRYLRLPDIYRRGWQYLEAAQYDDAILIFKEGIHLAKDIELPIWEFFFESWVCEVYVLSYQYKQALEWTTRLVAKSVRPEYADHPVRSVVYFTLAWVYYYVDAHGYHDEILQALDTLESDMPLDEETHHRSIFLRAEIAYEKDQFDTALSLTARYMNLVDGNPFRESSGYGMQRAIAYHNGDIPSALIATRLRGATAREARLLNNAVNSVLWEGVLLHYLGDQIQALATIERGIVEYKTLNLPEQNSYYHILSEYYTATGDYSRAMISRDMELQRACESGSLSSEFYSRLDRCYLLNRMGQSALDEIALAEQTARRSRKPEFLLQKLDPVREGKLSRYDWQIP